MVNNWTGIILIELAFILSLNSLYQLVLIIWRELKFVLFDKKWALYKALINADIQEMSTGHVVVSREWRNRLRGRSETEQRNFIPTSQTVASYAAGAIIENALNEIGNKFRLFYLAHLSTFIVVRKTEH